MKHIDQQGHKVKIGVAYHFIFGGPGPDVTSIVIEYLNEDGTVGGYDVNFKMKVGNLDPGTLYRPLVNKWDRKYERSAIIAYAGESALDLTP